MIDNDPGLLQGILLFVLLSLVGCGLLALTRSHRDTFAWQVKLFLVAIFLRFALSVAVYQFGLIDIIKDEDGSGWIRGAMLLDQWQHQGVTLLRLPQELGAAWEGHHRGYFYMLGAYFYLTESPVRLAAGALNSFFGALTAVFAYRIGRTLFSEWVARHVGWWTCLFPSMLIWSSLTVKEPVVILLETIALYGCICLRRGGVSAKHLVLCASTVLLLMPFRFYAAYIVGLAIVLGMTAPELFQPRRAFPAALMCGILIALVFGSGMFAKHETQFESFDLNRVQQFRKDVSTGGSGNGAGSGVDTSQYDMRTPGGFSVGTTIGAIHLLAAPFPWQLRPSARMLLTLPEVIYWWRLVLIGVIPGFSFLVRKRLKDVLVILLFIAGFGLLYSIMFGNVGLVFRQRAQLYPWLFLIAAVGLEQRALRQVAAQRMRELAQSATYRRREPQSVNN